jgi:uncharacterized protein YaaW (UPF0174 family)
MHTQDFESKKAAFIKYKRLWKMPSSSSKTYIHALIVEFTSAFNTTYHNKLLWIMYDLKFPTDAIDVVKYLYMEACTKIGLPLFF